MKLLLAASEVHPFAKTGGLADVAGALPAALAARGVEVAVCLPYYRKVRRRGDPVRVLAQSISCPFAGSDRPFRLLETNLPGSPGVRVLLVENPGMFEAEDAFYGTEPGSYGDAHLRFLYFCRALLRIPRAAGFFPDVFHLNDWQCALVAPLLRSVHRDDQKLSSAAVVLTIHNLAYQGVFPVEDLRHAGIPGPLLTEGRLLEHGVGNLMAAGIRFADAISTVSRSYAEEILTEEYGCGLEPVLHWRRELLTGIVNGLDTETWDPSRDPHLPATYDADHLEGKAVCKTRLLEECGLDPTDGPVFGVVSRLVAQKGLQLLPRVMDDLIDHDPGVRLVVLGSGEPAVERSFQELAQRHPRHVHARLAFDPEFSSRVEAGSDVFLMPSRFEPCGLNQLISMRYGTPPVVRAVGGLKDTVTHADDEAIAEGRATGFVFEDFTPEALAGAVSRALHLYRERPGDFERVRRAGMVADWSWKKSAGEYLELYEEARRRAADPVHLRPLLAGLPPDPLEVELPPVPAVPSSYPRDLLLAVPRDPRCLFCQWELAGGKLERFRETHPHGEPRMELVVEDSGTGDRRSRPVEPIGWTWMEDLTPGGRYRASLVAHAGDGAAETLLSHFEITLPADVWPEDL